MLTVLRLAGFLFFFYSDEGSESPHVHVERADEAAKFWLEPVELANSSGFSAREINQLRKTVTEQ